MYNITIIGCGKMGAAMVHSWLKDSLIKRINIIDPNQIPNDLANDPHVKHYREHNGANINDDIIVIAVKPQIIAESAQNIVTKLSDKTLTLSIADLIDKTRSRKQRPPILMQRNRHYIISFIERRLHTITVMHIDIQKQHLLSGIS